MYRVQTGGGAGELGASGPFSDLLHCEGELKPGADVATVFTVPEWFVEFCFI